MQKNNPLRLIIDTNLWISFLISDKQHKLDNLLIIEKVKILFSAELINEINNIASQARLRKYFAADAAEEMLLNMETYIDFIEIKSKVNICRDPKDNFLLALAKDGKANFLLTGDKDLLELKKFSKTNIITITNFFERIK